MNMEQIFSATSKALGVDVEKIKSKSRNPELVQCRQVICKLAKDRTKLPLKTIGIEIGNKHHATVIHALQTFEYDFQTNYKGLKDKFNSVCLVLEGVQ